MNAGSPRRVSGFAGVLAALLGGVVLVGWMLDVPALTTFLSGTTATKANTALCLILSGLALRVASAERALGRARLVAIVFSVLVLLACGLTLVEYLTGYELGIDEALVTDTSSSRASGPGRMGPNSAVAFLLLNASMLLLLGRPDRSRLTGASLLGTLTAVLGGFAVTGYLGNVAIGYGWSDATSMSFLAGVCFVVMGTACFALAWTTAGLRVAIGGRLLAGFAVGLAVIVALGVVSYKSAGRFAEPGDWVRHTVEVLARLGDLRAHVSEAQIAERAFVVTGRDEFLKMFLEGLAKLEDDERTLRRLTADNPVQQARLATLKELFRQRRTLWAETLGLSRREGPEAAAGSVSAGRGQQVMSQIGSLAAVMERLEQELLAQREARRRGLTVRTLLVLPVGTFAGVSVLLAVLFSLNSEVTDRQRAQLASRQAAAVVKSTDDAVTQLGIRLTTTLENMNNAFFTVDREWRFTYLNQECERLLQRTRADLLGKGLWDEFKEAIGGPSDRNYHQAMSENRAVAFEEFYPPLGMWLEVTAHPSSEGLAVYFHDITERKQAVERLQDSEERFSAAFRSSPAPLAINRRGDQICLEVNDSFLRLFEVTREEVIGHTLAGLGLLEEASVSSLRQQLADTGSVDNAEVPSRTRSGKALTISLSVRVIQVAGEPCAISIILDVTERRQAEDRIQRFNTELEQRVIERTEELQAANAELEAFSYSVSHDLRAPLRTVDGFSQALLEDFGPQLPEEGQRQVRTIREGAQRMGALIDDLLAFSRLGRQSLRPPVTVDMEGLVRECLEDLLPERKGRRIEICTGSLPSSRGDQAMFKQVWTNLLANAIKYTRTRPAARLEIGSVAAEGETDYFVRDNGTGFDMRYADKLFSVFQRLHRAEEFEGTGVGLAIVKRIVQRHGGRVWADAAVDRGATFHFALPTGAAS